MGFFNVTAQVRHEEYQAMKKAAIENKIPMAEIIRQAVALWLEKRPSKGE